MKRAIRFLRRAAIAASALVCVAAVADRVWDHWAGHDINATSWKDTSQRTVMTASGISSVQGVVSVHYHQVSYPVPLRSHRVGGVDFRSLPPEWDEGREGDSLPGRLGFVARIETDLGNGARVAFRYWIIEAPHWFIATVTAIAPACWLAGHLRRRRDRDANRCHRCGYDLRATPDRCPECGEVHEIA